MAGDRDPNRLDVPRVVPNRAHRRQVRITDRPVPSIDEARVIGHLAKMRARALAVAAVMGDVFDVAALARQDADGAE